MVLFVSNLLFLNKTVDIKNTLRLYILMLLAIFCFKTHAQKVGVVLSGGGAAGIAHIGVLKALEENNIPIDYITGTSAGALIGGLYASGYSPAEIEHIVKTEQFQQMVKGEIEKRFIYYYKQSDKDASWITIKINKDSLLKASLPTHFTSSAHIDFDMMQFYSGPNAAANQNFDSLYIPFRCVASDITDKKSVVFKNGFLNEAIRASMTYPLYVKPLTVDGKVLFDGGLYNNFPVDIMKQDFNPDIIIGSNVSANFDAPTDDNLISQVANMLLTKTDYNIPAEDGIMISPNTSNIGTFEFNKVDKSIEIGYNSTIALIDSIKQRVKPRISNQQRQLKRGAFKNDIPLISFDEIEIQGLNKNETKYIQKTLIRNKETEVSLEEIKKRYYRVYLDDRIKFVFPKAEFKPNIGKYKLILKVQKEEKLSASFGGNFSSRPINSGFLAARYYSFGKFGLDLYANSYFGKFYGSVLTKAKIDFPTKIPFYIEPYFSLNRFDYFKSAATFFEDVKPSYIINNEQFVGGTFGIPLGNRGKLISDLKYADLRYDYYQTENFLSTDTADITHFYPISGALTYERSTLNRKQFANQGTFLKLQTRVVAGDEVTLPGSTSMDRDSIVDYHEWIYFKATYQNYFKKIGKLRLGLYAEGLYSTQKFFENYSATMLAAPAFEPIPESQTRFLDKFRAYQYLGGGLNLIYNFTDNIECRLNGYIFQPIWSIKKDFDLNAVASNLFENRYYMASSAFIYHTPLGPISFNVNYYDTEEKPFTFLVNFGYLIYNKKAIH